MARPGGSEPAETLQTYVPSPPVADSANPSSGPGEMVPKSGPDAMATFCGAAPVSDADTFTALVETSTAPLTGPPTVGWNRTMIGWLTSDPRLNVPPETMLNGALVVALPVSVPPPRFWM